MSYLSTIAALLSRRSVRHTWSGIGGAFAGAAIYACTQYPTASDRDTQNRIAQQTATALLKTADELLAPSAQPVVIDIPPSMTIAFSRCDYLLSQRTTPATRLVKIGDRATPFGGASTADIAHCYRDSAQDVMQSADNSIGKGHFLKDTLVIGGMLGLFVGQALNLIATRQIRERRNRRNCCPIHEL